MGKLRIEPKTKPPVTDEEYARYKRLLQDAKKAADDHFVFYDLEPGEKINQVRKALTYVAEREGIRVSLRRVPQANSLRLSFPAEGRAVSGRKRLTAEEAQELILDVLRKAGQPLARGEILARTGISPASWTLRIRELLGAGKVVRQGKGRDSTYSLA
ncbi:MAG: hypothetical protein Kow00109_04860 [Acidobacteriota bacterium]